MISWKNSLQISQFSNNLQFADYHQYSMSFSRNFLYRSILIDCKTSWNNFKYSTCSTKLLSKAVLRNHRVISDILFQCIPRSKRSFQVILLANNSFWKGLALNCLWVHIFASSEIFQLLIFRSILPLRFFSFEPVSLDFFLKSWKK